MRRKRLWKKFIAAVLTSALTISGFSAYAAENGADVPEVGIFQSKEDSTFTGNLAYGKLTFVSGVEPGMPGCTGDKTVDGDPLYPLVQR